ncbi:type II toxin-antitoxin system RelB/DinJ family antitoxin [Candidatus Wolfebacteria bacterium]|nr:type II toxin-antitoxin system RelB/DinJ family antitoxin [Candidatus Wolfebacteria bacterium]
MNTHTILNIKTDKKLKEEAKDLATELGVPLSTVVNSFLKQFVRDKEITFSTERYRMTPYLEEMVHSARSEYSSGKVQKFKTVESFIADMQS